MARQMNVAVVGATGAVGREMLEILRERSFPHADLRVLASARSAGTTVPYADTTLTVEELTDDAFSNIDLALFSAGGSISKRFAQAATDAGTIIVDNSSAFRMTDGVPLIVPEVNSNALASLGTNGQRRAGVIANPNCSTIIMLVPMTPIRAAFGVKRMVVSTYQAASGAGAKGMTELEDHTRADLVEGRLLEPEVFTEPYAFNVFSHDSQVDPVTGRNVEEQKMIDETHKIWGDTSVGISATCIRVPTRRSHAEAINVTLERPATVDELREVLAAAPGVTLVDDRQGNRFPTPLKAAGGDDVLVGRIRPDASRLAGADPAGKCIAFDLFVCGDQLRKGAALNAIQIAELL